MPILSAVESRSTKGKLIQLSVIVMLILGSITMVYPFIVMVSGSFRSEMDQSQLNILPTFWFDDAALYSKFIETKYNQDVASLNRSRNSTFFDFERTLPPAQPDIASATLLEQWIDAGIPEHWQMLGGALGVRTTPENLRRLRNRLHERYGGDIDAFIRESGVPVAAWGDLAPPPPEWFNRRFNLAMTPVVDEYLKLSKTRPAAERQLVSLSGLFLERMIYPVDGQVSTDRYNSRHPEAPLTIFSDFRLPRTAPPESQPTLRQEWIEFVREELNPSFILVNADQLQTYRAALVATYENNIEQLNRAWNSTFGAFDEIALPDGKWLSGATRQDYEAFLRTCTPDVFTLTGPEYAWNDYVTSLGQASAEGPLLPPVADLEWKYVTENSRSLRWQYTFRNYINVWDGLVTQGNALANTAIFVGLSIFLGLIVNPMAAYALSRYRLPGTYKILLVLMATIAFPPMVALIPQFILLQKLDLFNTFIALIIPLLVDGYMIFLLKGFFDSLPRELYEAARIDGASELRMFFDITMALSKPILAVLALGTFTAAYTSFLYPMLVAPNRDMWLISVWLYQFQQNNNPAGVFALVVASIPTLIVFLFVQRTIMRGIVVPTEK